MDTFEFCSSNISFTFIIVECVYSVTSTATGFQVIVQPNELNPYQLYANKSMRPDTTAIVNVNETGQYHVSVLPNFGESGITESRVVYSETVAITESMPTGIGIK